MLALDDVDVGAAQAALLHLHEDLAGKRLGVRQSLESQGRILERTRLIEYPRAHPLKLVRSVGDPLPEAQAQL